MVDQVADQDARLDSDAGDISFLGRKTAQRDWRRWASRAAGDDRQPLMLWVLAHRAKSEASRPAGLTGIGVTRGKHF